MRSIPAELAQSALDAAPDAMLIVDAAGIIRFANRQVDVLFGFSRDDLIGQSIEKLIPARFHDRHVEHRLRYMDTAYLRPMGLGLELFARRKDGAEFPVEISLSPIQNEGQRLVAAAIRDVTGRKRAEAELIAARREAEQAQEAADRANQGKSRFLATASHDLRQPLQALSLLNRTLRSLVTDPLAREALSQQEHTISAMSRLLNTLLDISKLESGAVEPEPRDFTVQPLFEQLRREFSAVAKDKGLELQVETSTACVHTDPSLIEEVLRNLVSNAIKYTREGHVGLRCLPEGCSYRIEVLDTGIGIAADQLNYIFDEFYQVGTPANSSREGYGLGLSIVKRIADLLGFSLTVRSEPGKGSVFSFTLPGGSVSTSGAPEQRAMPAPPQARARSARVLLVEDDPAVRNATSLLLSVEGYTVRAVSSLAEALAAARDAERIDLLITDYHLRSGETGLKVITALREILGSSLKVLLITGDTSSVVRKLSADSSLRIISKPVDADEMLAVLAALLKP